ncbi:ECF RNA polymerase sigma factor SigE [Aquisphaera giovannonii]|uniref:ECF RNA polymerase sigma factor SigE n=1 Tax=Aquisphaera giovannonii TaxID=406548 RepID=A0A5B9VUT7_9BACT|nr:sigma-70 family RNA polymerase sigma factor [Aquisphaera giovannonii]QEH32018.1 ECF RNA polymerase sigma factor SigE [Aquisphaera giovannonii]
MKHIRSLFHAGTAAGLSDGQLLERFAESRGEAAELAFATLVERHGPMVLRVCRGIVRDDHEAEDAFQATFLMLARKGRSLWVEDSLGPWLHRVACRVAIAALHATGRRRAAQRRAAECARDCARGHMPDDRGRAIHEEIDRLPARYRMPIVLCDVEERSYEDAARHMGCPIGTIKSRLARGRERLRDRLTRRGLAPSAVATAFHLPEAQVAASLADRTTRAALWCVTGRLAGAPASATVAQIVKEASRTMAMARLHPSAFVGIALGAALIGGVAGSMGGRMGAVAPAARDEPGAEDPRGDLDRIRGTWVRVSTSVGKNVVRRLVVRKATKPPEGEIPAGAGWLDFEWRGEGDPAEAAARRNRVLLDPTAAPGKIDFLPEGEGATLMPGIYKLDGDTLTVCFRPTPGERPGGFAPASGPSILDVYRRAGP